MIFPLWQHNGSMLIMWRFLYIFLLKCQCFIIILLDLTYSLYLYSFIVCRFCHPNGIISWNVGFSLIFYSFEFWFLVHTIMRWISLLVGSIFPFENHGSKVAPCEMKMIQWIHTQNHHCSTLVRCFSFAIVDILYVDFELNFS